VSDVLKSIYMTLTSDGKTCASGLFFELPYHLLLNKAGTCNLLFLGTYRKYAIVLVLIIAAIVTPPDVVSQTIVAMCY
jgi:sec-independent protein translocase protein TatC